MRPGVAAGIKLTGDLDMAVIASPTPCTAAATFTQCKFPAAPILYDRQVVDFNLSGIRGVVVNSGYANARMMAESLEKASGSGDSTTLVMSTGAIGVQRPMDRIRAGVPAGVDKLKPEGWHDAARGIITTDTFPKLYTGGVALDGEEVRISGISKGAGMIHPDMATMLSVMATNAAVTAPVLQAVLSAAVRKSFNCISVDGDTSTTDIVLLLANDQGSAPVIDRTEGPLWEAFLAGLTEAAIELSPAIVRDGEGATKVVSIEVAGAKSGDDAHNAARRVSISPLVKTAFYGSDANWGRILCAAGNSEAEFAPAETDLFISADGGPELQLVAQGTPLNYAEEDAAAIFAETEVGVRIDLGLGQGEATIWTWDFSHEYVTINGDYRT